jgi:flagellar hook-associated protein 1 FlgK
VSDLLSSLAMAARSLDAQRYGMDVVGQNLANVNTPGYSRRSILLAEVPPLVPRSAGGGVEVMGVTAARAPLLDSRLYREYPAARREAAIADQLAGIEALIGLPGQSLDKSLSEFFDAFARLAEDPASAGHRYLTTTQSQSLTQAFQDISRKLERAQLDADAEVRLAVEKVNALGEKIASLNVAIANAPAGTAEGLRDQQNLALKELSELVDIGVVVQDGTSVGVTLGNGRVLVAAEHTYPLSVVSAPPQGLAQIVSGSWDITGEIAGGRIGGVIHSRDVLIPDYVGRLDQIAFDVASSVNALHTAGFDLAGAAGLNFFTPPAAVAGAARTMAVNPVIMADPDLVAAAGVPLAGDNQTARAIAALRDGTPSPTEAWGTLAARVGSDRVAAEAELGMREDMISQLESLRSQISGVSIDEEAATMMRFQRAYEANARFFSVVDDLLDVLMANVAS